MPNTQIAKCISTFLSCLDNEKDKIANMIIDDTTEKTATKTTTESTSLENDCYKSFQDCSGSIILIPGLYNGTSTETQGINEKYDIQ